MSAVTWYDETTETLAGKSLDDLAVIWNAADGQVNWLKGDIALEVDKSYGDDEIGKFADMVGVKKHNLEDYRRVAKAYPGKSERSDFSWSVCRELASEDNRLEILAEFKRQGRKTVKDAKNLRAKFKRDAAKESSRQEYAAQLVIINVVSAAPDGMTREDILTALKAAGFDIADPDGKDVLVIRNAFKDAQKEKSIVQKDNKFYPPSAFTGPEAEVKQEKVTLPTVPQARDLIVKALTVAGSDGLEVFTLEGFEYEDMRVRAIGGTALTSLIDDGSVTHHGKRYYLSAFAKADAGGAEIWFVNEKDQSTEAKDLDVDYLALSMVEYFGPGKAREIASAVLGITEPDTAEKELASYVGHPSQRQPAEKKEDAPEESSKS